LQDPFAMVTETEVWLVDGSTMTTASEKHDFE
jgi:hypothetical protein